MLSRCSKVELLVFKIRSVNSSVFILLGFIFVVQIRGVYGATGTANCVLADQRKITGECTHSEAFIYLGFANFQVTLQSDTQTKLPASLDITVTIGTCPLKFKAGYTFAGNQISYNDKMYGPAILIRVTSVGVDLYQTNPEINVTSIKCNPDFEKSGSKLKILNVLDMPVADKSIFLQFDRTADFSSPTATAKPGSDSGGVPTWGWVIIGISIFLFIICILVIICLCVRFVCCKKSKPTERVDAVVVNEVAPDQIFSECGSVYSNFANNSTNSVRMSIRSFESGVVSVAPTVPKHNA